MYSERFESGVFSADRANRQERLLILADSRVGFAWPLADAFLAAARESRIQVVAVCDTAAVAPEPAIWNLPRRVWEQFKRPPLGAGGGHRLHAVASARGVPLVVPPERDVNSEAFLGMVRDWRPTMTLSLGCRQILREPLIDAIGFGVNFHDGTLPDYRGVLATAWSIYEGAARSGYSFHRIAPGVDTGDLLVVGDVEVRAGEPMLALLARKVESAVRAVDAVLERMGRRAEGGSQPGGGGYYSRKQGRAVMRIADPAVVTAAELRRRLLAFGVLELRVGGRWLEVSELGTLRSRWGFVAACGERVAVRRCLGMPVWLYLALEKVRRR